MSHWARPGAKCVCLTSTWRKGKSLSWGSFLRALLFGLPVRGGTYCISAVLPTRNGAYLLLKGWGECGFHIANFRPLVDERETRDIALFAPLLDPDYPVIADDAPVREGAGAA